MSADNIEGIIPLATPDETIPVLEERLVVGKRLVESGHVRIHIGVSEHEETVETTLMRQDLAIERVPVGRDISEAPPVRTEGDTVIVPVIEERLVLVRQLVLKEELHIRIGQHQQPVREAVRLRREHAEIKRTNDEGNTL